MSYGYVAQSWKKERGIEYIKRRDIEPRCDCKFERVNVQMKDVRSASTHLR